MAAKKTATKKTATKKTAKKVAERRTTPRKRVESKSPGYEAKDSDVEEVLSEIDEHPMSSSAVDRSTTISFLKGIIAGCQTRIESVEEDAVRNGEELSDDA